MENFFVIKNISELSIIAKKILEFCRNERKFAFYGEMGSGKTTLIKAICSELGVKDNMSSPTFSIINEYHHHEPVYHMDFYRMKNLKEITDIGAEEYFNNDNYCFIEWPEMAEPVLPGSIVKVKIEVKNNGERIIKITKNG